MSAASLPAPTPRTATSPTPLRALRAAASTASRSSSTVPTAPPTAPAAGIEVEETAVGDRYVIEAMRRIGAGIGGEQSGHVILADCSTTGDGLITALRLLGRMASTGKPLSELAAAVERYPQVLVNVA